MKKWILLILLAAVVAGCGYWWLGAGLPLPSWLAGREDSSLIQDQEQVVKAIFTLPDSTPVKAVGDLPHFRLRLPMDTDWKLSSESLEGPSGTQILLTVESWGSRQLNTYENNPLADIATGVYDESILQLCRQLPRQGQGIFLRLNPDMEVPGDRYPWQQYPAVYISAFQRFAELIHEHAPKARVLWGPAGYAGAMEFYPGDSYVDAASVTARSQTEQGLGAYPVYQDLGYDLFRRLHRLRILGVPILVLGEGRSVADSLSSGLMDDLAQRINSARDVAYEAENLIRSETAGREAGAMGRILVGVYDPKKLLLDDPGITVEHLFVDFKQMHNGEFKKSFSEVIARDHSPIVSFEPFNLVDRQSDSDVLLHVTEGRYDKYIRDLFKILASTDKKVYLRYAHEMEIPIYRYAWQSSDPVKYIESFRYFMAADTVSENVAHVWGPAGDRGSDEWYPGNEWVDYVSIAIYGLPDKNITDPTKQESFGQIFNRKMWRMRFIDKPVFITEFGVKGPEDYQTAWMLDAARVLRDDHRIVGVNYFNMSDTPAAWGEIKPPDWSITRSTLDAFLVAVQKE